MPLDPRKNFSRGTLASGINNAVTSLSVTTGHGARFPDPDAIGFEATIYNSTDYSNPTSAVHAGHGEIIRVTAISTDTFTIVRAQGGTSAVNLNVGGKTYVIVAGVTKKTLDDIDAGLVPAQAGKADHFLTTDGSTAAWTFPWPNPRRWSYYYEDFLNGLGLMAAGTSGGTLTEFPTFEGYAVNSWGYVRASASSVNAYAYAVGRKDLAYYDNGRIIFEGRIQCVGDLPSSGQDFWWGCGLGAPTMMGGGGAGSGAMMIYICADYATTSGEFHLRTSDASFRHSIATGISPTVDTYYDIKIEISADASVITAWINGTQIAQIDGSSSPTAASLAGAGRFLKPSFGIFKTVGSTERSVDCDYLMVAKEWSTLR